MLLGARGKQVGAFVVVGKLTYPLLVSEQPPASLSAVSIYSIYYKIINTIYIYIYIYYH